MGIPHWLNRPYPLVERPQDKARLVLAFALFTYCFLLLYQPFGAAEIRSHRSWFLLGFAASVALVLSFNYFLLPRLFRPLFQADRWQVKKEIFYISWSFCLIAALNYGYNSSVGKDIAPQYNLLQYLGITLSVGIFPLLGQIFLTERYLNRRNRQVAAALRQQKTPTTTSSEPRSRLSIHADTLRSGPLELALQDFIYATADGNYTTVFYWRDGQVQKRLLRLSLKNVAQQLADFEDIIRCHRSYVVNKRQIEDISGNARSLNLRMADGTASIPVSRTFPREDLL